MKALWLLLMAPLAFAGTTAVMLTTELPSLTTNSVTAAGSKSLFGEVVAVAVSCETNVTVGVFATGGGMSIGAERTIMDYTAVTPASGLYTNISATVWTFGDNVEIRTKSSSATNNVVKVNIQTAD